MAAELGADRGGGDEQLMETFSTLAEKSKCCQILVLGLEMSAKPSHARRSNYAWRVLSV